MAPPVSPASLLASPLAQPTKQRLARAASFTDEPSPSFPGVARKTASSPALRPGPVSGRKVFLKRSASADTESPRSSSNKTVFDDSNRIIESIAFAVYQQVETSGISPSWIESIDTSVIYLDERTYTSSLNEDRIVLQPLEEFTGFLARVQQSANFSPEVLISAFHLFTVLAQAAMKKDGRGLSPATWRLGILCCLLLAQKVADDVPYDNNSFVTLLNNATGHDRSMDIGVHDLNKMEGVVLSLLNFKVIVSPQRFTSLFFALDHSLTRAELDGSSV